MWLFQNNNILHFSLWMFSILMKAKNRKHCSHSLILGAKIHLTKGNFTTMRGLAELNFQRILMIKFSKHVLHCKTFDPQEVNWYNLILRRRSRRPEIQNSKAVLCIVKIRIVCSYCGLICFCFLKLSSLSMHSQQKYTIYTNNDHPTHKHILHVFLTKTNKVHQQQLTKRSIQRA